jgi:glycosyltransferase involved in cell wall biosynthesis
VRLYALALVKDEADVIGQSITHALDFCDRVVVLDNGSTDDSWAVVEELGRRHPGVVIPWGVERRPFERRLRGLMYDELRTELTEDDWFLQLDADEFLLEDPRPALARAAAKGYDRIRTWQAQFQFTDVDLARWEAGEDDRSLPIEERRHHFVVDWRESRFWRNRPDQAWGTSNASTVPQFAQRAAPWALVNRHYQYRDPEQIQHRIEVRAAVRSEEAFGHVTSEDWRQHVVPASKLRVWHPGEPLRPWPWRFYVTRVRQLVGR